MLKTYSWAWPAISQVDSNNVKNPTTSVVSRNVPYHICLNQEFSISCCFHLLILQVIPGQNCPSHCFWCSEAHTCTQERKKAMKQHFPILSTPFNHLNLLSKLNLYSNPHSYIETHSHQPLILSSSAKHIQCRHVDVRRREAKKKLPTNASNPGRPDGQLQIQGRDPRPLPLWLRVSLCCLGRSWNRHHTSWLQMSRLIWHFQ